MKIALVYDVLRQEEKQLLEEAEALGLDVEPWSLNEHVLGDDELDFDFALMRSARYFNAVQAAQWFESKGVQTVEHSEVIQANGNKATTWNLLRESKIPIPETQIAFSVESAVETIDKESVIKPIIGSWGRLISIVKDAESARGLLEHKQALGAWHSVFLIQERVQYTKDVRVLVVDDEVVAAMERVPQNGEFRANMARGATAKAMEITPELTQIALQTMKVMNAQIASVDLFETKEGFLVNEVNATPEFRGLATATGAPIAQKIMEYMEGLQ